MKEILSVIVILFMAMVLAGAAYAGPDNYYKAHTAAKVAAAQGDLDKAAEMYLAAENEASVLAAIPEEQAKLDWALFAEWQRNNAAYIYIENFKAKTGWYDAMEAIKTIPNGPERLAAAEALKAKATPLVPQLATALSILKGKAFVKAEVLAKVKSNKEFCKWVIDFCK
jgi:hypothetical protein